MCSDDDNDNDHNDDNDGKPRDAADPEQIDTRLDEIAGEIIELQEQIGAMDATKRQGRKGRETREPSPSLMLRYKIGRLIQRYKRIAKEQGIVAPLSYLASEVNRSESDLAQHARLANVPDFIVEMYVEKGMTWREVAREMMTFKDIRNEGIFRGSPQIG